MRPTQVFVGTHVLDSAGSQLARLESPPHALQCTNNAGVTGILVALKSVDCPADSDLGNCD